MEAGPNVRERKSPVESRHMYSVALRFAGRFNQPLATSPFQPSLNFAQQVAMRFALILAPTGHRVAGGSTPNV